jgi:hypothetical protein
MVVMGEDLGALEIPLAVDDKAVIGFFHLCTQLCPFKGDGMEPVAFFYAEMMDISDTGQWGSYVNK